MTDQYAVFGNPIAHSRSPQIHALFAAQTRQDIVYKKQQVELDKFKETTRDFFAQGCGLNITVPFKLEAFAFADALSERAQRAGAVNTLKKMPDGKIFGDNTDGAGLLHDITLNLGWKITGKRVLILGAGGAVRGILAPLLAENPAKLVVSNRTTSKAQTLLEAFSCPEKLSICEWGALNQTEINESFDIVINGTAASLQGEMPALNPAIFAKNACAYDLMFNGKLPFLMWAKQHGAQVADGLGMLVEQAAESFYLWRGVRPETLAVIQTLREM